MSCNGSMIAPRSPSTDPASLAGQPRIAEQRTPQLRTSPVAVGCVDALSDDIKSSELNALELLRDKFGRLRDPDLVRPGSSRGHLVMVFRAQLDRFSIIQPPMLLVAVEEQGERFGDVSDRRGGPAGDLLPAEPHVGGAQQVVPWNEN